jgi:hypothetical protein
MLCGVSLSTSSSKLSFSTIWMRDEFNSRIRKYLSSLLERSTGRSSTDFLWIFGKKFENYEHFTLDQRRRLLTLDKHRWRKFRLQ